MRKKEDNRGDLKKEMTTACPARTSSLMDDLLGLLRIRIKRGVNLAVRDISSSDPYVVVKMGKQVCLFTKKITIFTAFITSKTFSNYHKLNFTEIEDSCH